jgi:hypothetical protein
MGGDLMSFATDRCGLATQTEKQFHRLPAVGPFCDAMEMEMEKEHIRTIDRLREAAAEHGEVADLLTVLQESILIDDAGNKEIVGNADHLAYLKAVLIAADFVDYDRAK